MIEGIAISIQNFDVQGAIDRAGRQYREKFSQPPTHVSLPGYITASDEVNTYTLIVVATPTSKSNARAKRHHGTVIVGRDEIHQLELF